VLFYIRDAIVCQGIEISLGQAWKGFLLNRRLRFPKSRIWLSGFFYSCNGTTRNNRIHKKKRLYFKRDAFL